MTERPVDAGAGRGHCSQLKRTGELTKLNRDRSLPIDYYKLKRNTFGYLLSDILGVASKCIQRSSTILKYSQLKNR